MCFTTSLVNSFSVGIGFTGSGFGGGLADACGAAGGGEGVLGAAGEAGLGGF